FCFLHMSKKKILYVAVAVVGIAVLGATAWWVQRAPTMSDAPLSLAEAGKAGAAGANGAAVPGGGRNRAGGGGGGGGGGPVAVEVVAVRSANLEDDVSAVGSIRSNQSVMLRPEVSGRIAAINFTDGQPVKKGQMLVGLDDSVN